MNPKAIIELGGELAPGLAAEAKEAGAKLLGSAGLADFKTVVVDGATAKTAADEDVIVHSLAFANGDEMQLDSVLQRPSIPSWGPTIEQWGGSRTSFAAPLLESSFARVIAGIGNVTEREAALARMSLGFGGMPTGEALTRWQNILAAAVKKGATDQT